MPRGSYMWSSGPFEFGVCSFAAAAMWEFLTAEGWVGLSDSFGKASPNTFISDSVVIWEEKKSYVAAGSMKWSCDYALIFINWYVGFMVEQAFVLAHFIIYKDTHWPCLVHKQGEAQDQELVGGVTYKDVEVCICWLTAGLCCCFSVKDFCFIYH